MPAGNVTITVVDGGSAALVVPGASTQLVLGCCSSGVVNQIVASKTPATFANTFGSGPLPEYCGLAALAGGTILGMKVPSATGGSIGTLTTTGGGTSVVTATGTPNDTYYVQVLIVTGGTIASASPAITFRVSLDAGRSFRNNSSPVLALNTANTYLIPGTGVTLNFAAGTVLAGETVTFSTNEPYWNTAGIQAALNAFQLSQYSLGGVGSIHIVGSPGFTTATGPSASTIQGYMNTLANGFIFERAWLASRDASPPALYSGSGETEAAWTAALQTDYSAVSAVRMSAGAGYWNIPTPFPNPSAWGAPSYRRPSLWAAMCRQVAVPPKRHLGRVKDGALQQIVVDPTNDPSDGFIYHDERVNPGLDYLFAGTGSARFITNTTRVGAPGVFVANPLSLAPIGSDFFITPYGLVMDVFATQFHTTAQNEIDDDIRVNPNGTIFENDARAIEAVLASKCNAALSGLISVPIVAGPAALAANTSAIAIDRSANVRATGNVPISGQIVGLGYILSISATLSFQNPNAAA